MQIVPFLDPQRQIILKCCINIFVWLDNTYCILKIQYRWHSTSSQIMIRILAKAKSTGELVWDTTDFKVRILYLSFYTSTFHNNFHRVKTTKDYLETSQLQLLHLKSNTEYQMNLNVWPKSKFINTTIGLRIWEKIRTIRFY